VRVVLAILAGIIGAIAGAGSLSFLLACIIDAIEPSREGMSGLGGFFIGVPVGVVVGFGLGLWLVLRSKASLARITACLVAAAALAAAAGIYAWENG